MGPEAIGGDKARAALVHLGRAAWFRMRSGPGWGKERVSVERLPDMNQNPKGREGI